MAIQIIGSGLSSLQLGVESSETGFSIETFECRYYPELDRRLPNNTGETIGRARSTKFSRDLTASGEVTGATGWMALTLIVDATSTITNDKADFGDGSGIFLLDEVTVSQQRAEFRKVSFKLSSNPLLTSIS